MHAQIVIEIDVYKPAIKRRLYAKSLDLELLDDGELDLLLGVFKAADKDVLSVFDEDGVVDNLDSIFFTLKHLKEFSKVRNESI
jgi:hypothetical protein